MRRIEDVVPPPDTPEEITRHGLSELASLPSGSHQDPSNHEYGIRRDISEYAQEILAAAKEASGKMDNQEVIYPGSYRNDRLEQQIEEMMSFHPARRENGQPERYEALRNAFKELSHFVNGFCPDGRAKSLSLTHLEEALMRAIQAIAVGEDK